MSKVIKLLNTPVPKGKYALVPFGLYLNKALQKAESGTLLEFQTSWRRDTRVLVRKCRVPVNSSMFTFMCKSLYGEGMSWASLSKQWRAESIIEGLGKDAFSDSEVLLIEVAPYDEAQHKAEQEAKRKAKEEAERHAERDKVIENARNGAFDHPMIKG